MSASWENLFERANAWGLDPELDLVVRVEFSSPHYLDSVDAPKVTCVRQAQPNIDLNVFELKHDQATTCGLEWVLKDRLNSFLREVTKERVIWCQRGSRFF